ncbi:rhodanese-like domain-containing protein [Salisediminibacterium halotolerans]|uniref:3-mercaptopyruvate sulfurtransferase SseA, contains two rhodanese domains n=1 Tax=Salisediminibacterium halotolerans TaxID=517425 RepID=A0A1H9WU21_9BACI|nr:rhodanese-like domain-containing protein [Salisediminibacterium haloalkalitolerans]SES37450.1 3-mercaptopyruvate sulfurtransferase SseA, contains two rhodanese domains [Salisediminibacterium haloalkalitolerans]
MKLLYTVILQIALLLLLASCQTGSAEEAEANVSFENEENLSEYIIAEQESGEDDDHVPYNEDWNYIETDELTRLLEGKAVTSEERTGYEEHPPEWDGLVLVDSRPQDVYSKGHINGAVNIPDGEFDEYKDRLPDDKEAKLVFYCGGLHCALSGNSSEKAMELGYENSYVYQEGIPAWNEAGNYFVTDENHVEEQIMASAVERDDNTPVTLIDARTYEGYFESHIPTAVFWDDGQINTKYDGAAPADKDQEIIVYCGGFFCGKSHAIAEELTAEGYTNVKVFAGGMPLWNDADLPTFGTAGEVGDFDVTDGQKDRSIAADEFHDLVDNGETVLDVRSDDEVASGMIDGALHIPDDEIRSGGADVEEMLPEDKDEEIVLHCASGARAGGVVEIIAEMGYENVHYWNGGISVDEDGTYELDDE